MKKSSLFYFALLLPVIVFFVFSEAVDEHSVMVQKGIADFRTVDLDVGVFQLNGDWEYYPNKLLSPGAAQFEYPRYAYVPARWIGDSADAMHSSFGIATYRMRVLSKEKPGTVLGFTTDIIRTASKVYINGKQAGAVGAPAAQLQGYIAENKPATYFFETTGQDEIIIQVANFTHGDGGGIISPVTIGSNAGSFQRRFWYIVSDVIVLAVLATMLALFIGQFFQRNDQLELLWFSMTCLVAIVFYVGANEKLLFWIVPRLDYGLYLRIGYSASALVFFCLCHYILVALRGQRKIIRRYIDLSTGAFLLIFVFAPVELFTQYKSIVFAWEVSLITIVVWKMILGVFHRTDGYKYLAFAVICFIVVYSSYVLDVIGLYSTGNVLSVTVFMFLVSQMLFITERHKLVWLKRQNEAKELELLRAQINPHFIYNALASVASLISIDPAKARYTLLDFSNYLRSTLNKDNQKQLIPLAEELELTRYYTDIEAIRYDERLQVRFEVPPEIMDTLIPPFIVQTIVENAIKHCVLDDYNQTIVSISGLDGPNTVTVTVTDNGPGISRELMEKISDGQTRGIGIYNARQRLKKFGGNISFESCSTGLQVRIELRN